MLWALERLYLVFIGFVYNGHTASHMFIKTIEERDVRV